MDDDHALNYCSLSGLYGMDKYWMIVALACILITNEDSDAQKNGKII